MSGLIWIQLFDTGGSPERCFFKKLKKSKDNKKACNFFQRLRKELPSNHHL